MFFSIFILLLTVLVFMVNLVVFVISSSVLPPDHFVFQLFVHQTLLRHVLFMLF